MWDFVTDRPDNSTKLLFWGSLLCVFHTLVVSSSQTIEAYSCEIWSCSCRGAQTWTLHPGVKTRRKHFRWWVDCCSSFWWNWFCRSQVVQHDCVPPLCYAVEQQLCCIASVRSWHFYCRTSLIRFSHHLQVLLHSSAEASHWELVLVITDKYFPLT